ncbi:MAG TPA: hypothetical protein VGM20_03110 [Gemmatimonadales bacterium]|jgi:hypothetical protein
MEQGRQTTHPLRATIGAVLLLAAWQGAASAQVAASGLHGRIWGGAVGRYVLTDNEAFASPGFGTVSLQVAGSAPGFGADAELRMNRWIGLDGAIGYSSLKVQFTTTAAAGTVDTDHVTVVPLLLSLNLHLVHADAVDIWVGPQIGYVIYPHDLSFASSAGTFSYTPKNVFSAKGFVVGSDIRLSKSVALNLGFRWQNADGDSGGHLTIDPTFVTIGLATHF